MVANMKQIREAVTKHRGGWTKASDAEIMTVWNMFPDEIKKEYLDNIKPKGKPDAGTIRPRS